MVWERAGAISVAPRNGANSVTLKLDPSGSLPVFAVVYKCGKMLGG